MSSRVAQGFRPEGALKPRMADVLDCAMSKTTPQKLFKFLYMG